MNRNVRNALIALALFGATVGTMLGLAALSGPRPGPSPTASASALPAPGIGDTAVGGQGQDVDGVRCPSGEQLTFHVHAHVAILVDGQPATVSAGIGIPGFPGASRCFYWLHTHDTSGVVHIEAPARQVFVLGQFFDIWGMPLGPDRVSNIAVGGRQVAFYLNEAPFSADPRTIPLGAHASVVIEIGRQVTPPRFDFGNL